jgi:dTDP-4-amino-4,6-dideoxygalactose transaminase
MRVPFVDLNAQYKSIKTDIDRAIEAVIGETAFIGGKYVKAFESDFASLYGVKNVISCANGTDSLYILMKVLGIGEGDEVITAANSWISSSETISQTGATPVFADVDEVYYSMNERLLEGLMTSKTRAVIAVHLQGQMCQIEAIREICDRKGVYLIEDCAQSHFSTFNGVRAGLRGIAGSFSFYPGKNLGAYGDAGCIITNDDQLADKCRMYANHGALKKHHHIIEGINSRMDGIQAAILSAKLPYILQWTNSRIAKAALYKKHLAGISGIVMPEVREGTEHSWHLFVIRTERRDALMAHLKKFDIETAIHYPTALPNLPAYAYLEKSRDDFPVASLLEGQILSLPIFPEITEEQIIFVAEKIRDFFKD